MTAAMDGSSQEDECKLRTTNEAPIEIQQYPHIEYGIVMCAQSLQYDRIHSSVRLAIEQQS